MNNKEDMTKLSKKELMEIIESYKKKLESLEEFTRTVQPNYASF